MRRSGVRSPSAPLTIEGSRSLPLGVTGNTPDSGSGESWFEPRRGNSAPALPEPFSLGARPPAASGRLRIEPNTRRGNGRRTHAGLLFRGLAAGHLRVSGRAQEGQWPAHPRRPSVSRPAVLAGRSRGGIRRTWGLLSARP